MNIKFALDAVYSRTVIDYQLQKIIIFYFLQLGSFYWGLSCENEWVKTHLQVVDHHLNVDSFGETSFSRSGSSLTGKVQSVRVCQE